MPKLVGMNHIALEVGDLDEALEFWRSIFGDLELRGRGGSMAFIDATPEENDGLVLVEMIRVTGPDPITDEEIRAFLKPFRVGPKR